jgi:hypothetical protein
MTISLLLNRVRFPRTVGVHVLFLYLLRGLFVRSSGSQEGGPSAANSASIATQGDVTG